SRRQGGAFDRDQLASLTAVAGAVAPFVESALLLAQMAELRRRRDAFLALNRALASSLDLREIFDDVAAVFRPIFDCDAIGVNLMTPSGRTSERVVHVGGEVQIPRILTIDDFSLSGNLLALQPVLVDDARAECDPTRPVDRFMLDAGVASFVIVPLVFGERSGGVLYAVKREQTFWFDPLDVETMCALAGPVMLSVHHHRQVEQDK